MKLSIISRVTRSATAIAIVLGTSSTLVMLSAEPAFAQSSSNSSGRGSSGRGGTRVLTKNDNVVASNGGGAGSNQNVNASLAAPFGASDNAQSDMDIYRDMQIALKAAEAAQEEALAEYMRLTDLGDDAIATEFPDGEYDAALADATIAFAQSQETVTMAHGTVEQSLLQMTGGRTLSDDELASLHTILGL